MQRHNKSDSHELDSLNNTIVNQTICRCLKWVTIAARHPYPKKDPHAARLTYYKQFEKEIDDTGIVWPITLKQIPKFESLNRYANLI